MLANPTDEHIPKGILFLCVANSARSQMAEGIARSMAPPGTRIYSAGSRPRAVHPLAVQVLADIGIDISDAESTDVDTVDEDKVDMVITLCEEEICPIWLGVGMMFHWPLPDPAAVREKDRLHAFRLIRNEIKIRLEQLFEGEHGEGR